MKTVKEAARLAGISVRTLHYYDHIGLLKPSKLTESGYRFYSEHDLAVLQQILLLKELGFPLKNIKVMIYNHIENKDYLLEKQKELLILKRDRLNELIHLIDNLKEGGSNMSFKEFDTSQIDALFQVMLDKFDENQLKSYIDEHGGNLENAKSLFEKSFIEKGEELHRYTGNQDLAELARNAPTPEQLSQAQNRIQELNKLLAEKMDCDISDEGVQSIISELRDAHKSLFRLDNVDNLFMDMGKFHLENEMVAKVLDEKYGQGYAKFFGNAVLHFFKLS